MDQGLLLLILLIIASGLFSASEIALTAINKVKLKAMENDGRFGSQAILKLKSHPQRVLVTILISNQVVNILATVSATLWGIRLFGEDRVGLVTFFFTIALIVFGTISPKTMALRFSEVFARFIAYPLLGFFFIVRPVVWVFELIVKGFSKVLKIKHRDLPTASEREIEAMLDIGTEEGVIKEEEEGFMKQILKFHESEVGEIMTLLKDINAVDLESTQEELIEFFQTQRHTHFPVYIESLNNIKGILKIHGLIEAIYHSKRKYPLKEMRFTAPVVVPRTTSLAELFKVLKEKEKRMAIVVDEHGQTIGLVTLGDILEEITGLRVNEEKPEPKIEKVDKNLWEADGEVAISQINETLNMELKLSEHQTISLAVLKEIKRFPELNEKILIENLEVEITRVEKNVIKKVNLRKKPKKKEAKKL